jgi:hypothetical protein
VVREEEKREREREMGGAREREEEPEARPGWASAHRILSMCVRGARISGSLAPGGKTKQNAGGQTKPTTELQPGGAAWTGAGGRAARSASGRARAPDMTGWAMCACVPLPPRAFFRS